MSYASRIGRFVFGLWFLSSGINHWFEFRAVNMGVNPLSTELSQALMDSGLYTVVKLVQIVTGLMLILNLFAPLALVLAMPISIVVFYWNVVLEPVPYNHIVGTFTLGLNALMMLVYIEIYRPLLIARPPRE